MKVSREKSAQNREAVVERAGALLRERGIDGIGLADIMKAAGLTHGGFYRQFVSKDALVVEASRKVMARSAANWRKIADADAGHALRRIVDRYFGAENLADAAQGCMFAVLGADAARQTPELRAAFTDGLEDLVAVLAETMPGKTKAGRRQQALAAFAEMVGAMVLARAAPSLAPELVKAAKTHLLPA